jgi:hypothetical protein
VQVVLGIGQLVDDVHGPALERSARRDRAASRSDHMLPPELAELGRGSVLRDLPGHLAVVPEDKAGLGATQTRGVLDQRLQHRLEIERRATDNLNPDDS